MLFDADAVLCGGGVCVCLFLCCLLLLVCCCSCCCMCGGDGAVESVSSLNVLHLCVPVLAFVCLHL